jgi:hypothetical protein
VVWGRGGGATHSRPPAALARAGGPGRGAPCRCVLRPFCSASLPHLLPPRTPPRAPSQDSSRTRKDEIIVAEEEPEAESEAAGIRETQGERPSTTRRWVAGGGGLRGVLGGARCLALGLIPSAAFESALLQPAAARRACPAAPPPAGSHSPPLLPRRSYPAAPAAAPPTPSPPSLLHFSVTDKAGMVQPLERLRLSKEPFFATGARPGALFPAPRPPLSPPRASAACVGLAPACPAAPNLRAVGAHLALCPAAPSHSRPPPRHPRAAPGAVYAEEGALVKANGRRVERIGPIKAWSMTPATGAAAAAGPAIRITTSMGCYTLSRPLAAYKKLWAELQAQAALTAEVMQVRARPPGAAQGCLVCSPSPHTASPSPCPPARRPPPGRRPRGRRQRGGDL